MIETSRTHYPAGIEFPPDLNPLEQAILHAVTYADIFDSPLTLSEIERFCVGEVASLAQIQVVLGSALIPGGHLEQHEEFYTLPGRSALIPLRVQRQAIAARMWPRAWRYGRWLARLPFVRMVAVTGALAADNPREGDDYDYLLVTAPGRLWTCRAFSILLLRIVRLLGDEICPNYLLTEEALHFSEHNLFSAHEFVQMQPLAGETAYRQMRDQNRWTCEFLPNTQNDTRREALAPVDGYPLKALLEWLLSFKPGDWIEAWEMRRKIARFTVEAGGSEESRFDAHCCKGHFDRHGEHTLNAYQERVRAEA